MTIRFIWSLVVIVVVVVVKCRDLLSQSIWGWGFAISTFIYLPHWLRFAARLWITAATCSYGSGPRIAVHVPCFDHRHSWACYAHARQAWAERGAGLQEGCGKVSKEASHIEAPCQGNARWRNVKLPFFGIPVLTSCFFGTRASVLAKPDASFVLWHLDPRPYKTLIFIIPFNIAVNL